MCNIKAPKKKFVKSIVKKADSEVERAKYYDELVSNAESILASILSVVGGCAHKTRYFDESIDAEDLAQEVYLQLLSQSSSKTSIDRLENGLYYSIAYRHILNLHAKDCLLHRFLNQHGESKNGSNVRDPRMSEDELNECRELVCTIKEYVYGKLDNKCQTIFDMYFTRKMTLESIAEYLGFTTNNAFYYVEKIKDKVSTYLRGVYSDV